jgi:hypothetical protein
LLCIILNFAKAEQNNRKPYLVPEHISVKCELRDVM